MINSNNIWNQNDIKKLYVHIFCSAIKHQPDDLESDVFIWPRSWRLKLGERLAVESKFKSFLIKILFNGFVAKPVELFDTGKSRFSEIGFRSCWTAKTWGALNVSRVCFIKAVVASIIKLRLILLNIRKVLPSEWFKLCAHLANNISFTQNYYKTFPMSLSQFFTNGLYSTLSNCVSYK